MKYTFFILTALVVPFMPSGASVPRWAFASIAAAVLLFDLELSIYVWALCAYVGLMAWVAPVGYEAAYLYWHFLIFVVFFCYAKKHDIIDAVTNGVWAGIVLNSIVVVAQYLGWNGIPQVSGTYGGLFFNHNNGSEAAAMVFIMLAFKGRWLMILPLLPTLALGSRMPIEGIGIALFLILWSQSRFLSFMAVLGAQLIVFGQSHEAYSAYYSGDIAQWNSPHDPLSETMLTRIAVWLDSVGGLTIWGHGLGSFIIEFPKYQTYSDSSNIRYENPHNDILQILFEFGVVGVGLIGAFLYRMGRVKPDAAWYGLLVFMVEGLLDFPLYAPVTGILAAVCTGHLLSDRVVVRSLLGALRSGIQDRFDHLGPAPLPVGKPTVSPHTLPPFRSWVLGGQDGERVGDSRYSTGAQI
jgi:hypothetical protein